MLPDQEPEKLILIIDTDKGVQWSLERGLTKSGYRVRTASSVEQAVHVAQLEPVAAIVLELAPEAGLTVAVLSSLLRAPSSPKIVCTSIDAPPAIVIDCMRRGAADFLVRPFSLGQVRAALKKILTVQALPPDDFHQFEEEEDHSASLLIGVSPALAELRTTIKQIARTDLNCLILGQSGVGKDVVAREIHRLSGRVDKPFIKVNCSALPDQLLESELFGYEKGAFTGAQTTKPGRFSLADGGIIFLDEIGEMQANLQAKLLQVIEHKEFTRLGGRTTCKVDVHIVCATNTDIEEKSRNGGFRQDLFFRLNEVCIWVPPLSERRQDVPLLVRHFVQKYNHFLGDRPFEMSGEELQELSERDWPGNVRELESAVKRRLVLGRQILGGTASVTMAPDGTAAAKKPRREPTVKEISEALTEHNWNRRKAAESLGVSYQMLRRRIEKYKLGQPG